MPSQKGLKFSEPRVNSNSNDDAPGEQRDEWAQDQKARGDQHNRQANVNGRFERRAQLGFVERGLLNCHGRILLRTEHSWAVSSRSRTTHLELMQGPHDQCRRDCPADRSSGKAFSLGLEGPAAVFCARVSERVYSNEGREAF